MKDVPTIELMTAMAMIMGVVVGSMAVMFWITEKRRENRLRAPTFGNEASGTPPGVASGGYIVLELPETERPFFHDLLRGFEEFARLKGYGVTFSIDSSYTDKIAFKFTLRDDGISVGAERVRRDFHEYVEKVRAGAESLDNMPVITSMAEHDLLVTVLKNRISFLQHSYTLSRNAAEFYEGLFRGIRTPLALPGPSVIVQTGGTMDTKSYNATNSTRVIQGDASSNVDMSDEIRIAHSFNERREQIEGLEQLIAAVRGSGADANTTGTVLRNLENVKEELETATAPDPTRVTKWLTRVKELVQTGALGYQVVDATKKVLAMFGLA